MLTNSRHPWESFDFLEILDMKPLPQPTLEEGVLTILGGSSSDTSDSKAESMNSESKLSGVERKLQEEIWNLEGAGKPENTTQPRCHSLYLS